MTPIQPLRLYLPVFDLYGIKLRSSDTSSYHDPCLHIIAAPKVASHTAYIQTQNAQNPPLISNTAAASELPKTLHESRASKWPAMQAMQATQIQNKRMHYACRANPA
ncbi:hypothetical protein VTL71DRAFT_15901, partial [Oculimacula yallundae]